MKPCRVTGIDTAFQGLQPIALLQALRRVTVRGRHRAKFPFWQWRLTLGRTHIGPQHLAPLHQRIRFELDLLANATFFGLRWNLNALAGPIKFPAMIWAAKAVFFVAAEPQ